jgi:hypothetical protein
VDEEAVAEPEEPASQEQRRQPSQPSLPEQIRQASQGNQFNAPAPFVELMQQLSVYLQEVRSPHTRKYINLQATIKQRTSQIVQKSKTEETFRLSMVQSLTQCSQHMREMAIQMDHLQAENNGLSAKVFYPLRRHRNFALD